MPEAKPKQEVKRRGRGWQITGLGMLLVGGTCNYLGMGYVLTNHPRNADHPIAEQQKLDLGNTLLVDGTILGLGGAVVSAAGWRLEEEQRRRRTTDQSATITQQSPEFVSTLD